MYTEEQIFQTLQHYKEQIEAEGYIVHTIALKGSQNYNLDDDESDIDANAVIIPTLTQIRTGLPKKKFIFDDGEVTCHDLYDFAKIVAKGNPQWVEVCQTNYFVGTPLTEFKHFRLNPSALKGMVMEKVNAFDKLYPSRASIVEQFGYDPKQLHHIIRLYDCLNKGVDVYRYTEEEKVFMMQVKRGTYPSTKEEAFELRDLYLARLNNIYEDRKLTYEPQVIDYDRLDAIIMSYYIKDYHGTTTQF